MSEAHLERLNTALLGRYTVERKLGEGGMATVYLANDPRHERQVAIKVLKAELAAVLGAQRFLSEIKTTAQLQHPHILPLFDSGTADGFLYYVMPYFEGESLRERLDRERRLSLEDSVSIAVALASALGYAHRLGVLHRDIKPGNVLLSNKFPILMDFGIAVGLDDSQNGATPSGFNLGTLQYMSPEQAAGDVRLDARSDLYSLGCVLYEMLTGEPPHLASTAQAVVAKRLIVPAIPVRVMRPEVPHHIDDALRRTLACAPADRFDSVLEFAEHLRPSNAVHIGTRATSPRAGGFGVLVLPIVNDSRDGANQYFCAGLADEIIHMLGRVRGLRVVPPDSARSTHWPDERLHEKVQALGVSHALKGRVRFSGKRYRVHMSLIDAERGEPVWDERFEGTLVTEDVFDLQDQIAGAVVTALPHSLHLPDQVGGRPDPNAYDLYLRARDAWFTRDLASMARSIALFRRAIEIDPSYARAHSGLADVYNVLGGVDYSTEPPLAIYPNALVAAEEALRLDPNLGEAHAAMGNYLMSYAWDWRGARKHLERAIELNQWYSSGRQWYSNFLQYVGEGRRALEEAQRALEDDPRSVSLRSSLARHYMFLRQPEEAVEKFRWALEIDPSFLGARVGLVLAEHQAGRHEASLATLDAVYSAPGPKPPILKGVRAYILGFNGHEREARSLLADLATPVPGRYVPPEFVCLAHLGLGENERALDALQRAMAARSQTLSQLKVEPLLDPLRDHPRFKRILSEVGL